MKTYQKPEYSLIQLFDEDILTMSEGADGSLDQVKSFSFNDLIQD